MASRDHPYPPLDLAARVGNFDRSGDPDEEHERIGAEARGALTALLPEDYSFEGKRVLDFGCGAGRTLRQFLDEAESAEFWGVDIDGPSIDWLQRTLCPPLHARQGPADPPLEFETGSFDLIWALSVFTHLTENSLPWLAEMHRLLKPGGLLLATYMGRWNSEVLAGEPWDEDRVGMNVLVHDGAWEFGGPMVLMSDWWVREHWGRAFEIVSIEPRVQNQTLALLRRRDVELSVEDLEQPADDPREFRALQHNVSQLQRERAEVRRIFEHRISQYEGTMSWRLTRPLRRAKEIWVSRRSGGSR